MVDPPEGDAKTRADAQGDVASLVDFVDRHRSVRAVTEAFPVELLRRLADEPTLDDALEPVLVELFAMTGRYPEQDDGYEGEDLQKRAFVVPLFARLRNPTERAARMAIDALKANAFDRHYATHGSPDADKIDRDRSVETAQDALALAAARSLARLGAVTPVEAAAALRTVHTHRSLQVRSVAADVLRVVQGDPPPRG